MKTKTESSVDDAAAQGQMKGVAAVAGGFGVPAVWHHIDDKTPDEGQEVTLYHSHRQVRAAVKDKNYHGGFKERNCAGWQCTGPHWGFWWTASHILPPNTADQRRSPE